MDDKPIPMWGHLISFLSVTKVYLQVYILAQFKGPSICDFGTYRKGEQGIVIRDCAITQDRLIFRCPHTQSMGANIYMGIVKRHTYM